MKANCYKCEYRQDLSGSAHSRCDHPSIRIKGNEPGMKLLGLLASVGRVPGTMLECKELNIKGNPHGIKKGWFNWPMSFDPVWLENCDGFKEKKV